LTQEARGSIENLLAEYAFELDAGHFSALGELFAGGSVLIVGGPVDGRRADGATEIAEMFRKSILRDPETGDISLIRHQTSNVHITLTSPTSAEVKSYYIAFQQTTASPFQPVASGMYIDTVEVVDDAWRFKLRKITVDQSGALSGDIQARMKTS
jgi:hypothetical protein